MSLTFLEIQDQVIDIVGASSIEERGRIKRVINDVYDDVVQRILTPVKSSAVTTLTTASDYVLSSAPFSLSDFVAIRTVVYNQSGSGPNRTLERVSPGEIYQQRNQTYSGFLYAFALQGVDTLMLAPSPSTGDTLTIVYNYRPAPMATDSDTPSLLLDEDVDAIIVGAARRVSRWKVPARTAALTAEYLSLVDAAQARQNRKGGAAGMKLRRSGWRRPPHDPSTDTRGYWTGY